MPVTERKYALSKIGLGDYLLPSNDAQIIWRISRYSPDQMTVFARDQQVWGVWRWPERASINGYVDTNADWEFWEGMFDTRAAAIQAALASQQ